MTKTATILLTAGSALATFGAHAAPAYDPAKDPNGNMIGLTTPNGQLAYDFIDMWFNQHKGNEAWDKYVARKGYMNHAVYNSTTKTTNRTFEEEKAEEARAAGPSTVFKFKQMVAQGNLVFVHIAASQGAGGVGAATGDPAQGARIPAAAPAGGAPAAGAPPAGGMGAGGPPAGGGGPGGPGQQGDGKGPDEMFMVLRVKDGKIVDHWDVHVPTNSDSVVFEGLDRKLP